MLYCKFYIVFSEVICSPVPIQYTYSLMFVLCTFCN